MSGERRTIRGWVHHLTAPDAELTLSELMAKCLIEIRDNAVLTRLVIERTEGYLKTLDVTLAERDPLYQRHAIERAKPVPSTPELAEV